MRATRSTELITVEEPKTKRRFRSKQERRQIVEESLRPGASVAVIARRHGVNANQVFNWRKLYKQGLLNTQSTPAQLMPVRIAEIIPEDDRSPVAHRGAIHIELGKARVRLEGSVDPASLRLVLEHLLGRTGR